MNNKYFLITTFTNRKELVEKSLLKEKMANANSFIGSLKDYLEMEYKDYKALVLSNTEDKKTLKKYRGW